MKQSLLLAAALILSSVDLPVRAADPGDSVVKVYAMQRVPDWFHPWRKNVPVEATGSGAVIEGKLILTNAHVVLYANEIYVQARGGGEKVEAKIKAIGPNADLAVLTIDDKNFFAGRPALPRRKELPLERMGVEVYGYPIGGNDLSVTKGVISRIGFGPNYAGEFGLHIQVDAALNPGNSGGPAFTGKEMIGVAFSRLGENTAAIPPASQSPQNIGYLIPNEEIDLFLQDAATGHYEGKPYLDWEYQSLENPYLRKKLNLNDKLEGVLIRRQEGPLQELDVLTHIGSYALDNRGQVQARDNLRFHFYYAVVKLARGNKVSVTVVRQGKVVKIDVPLFRRSDYLLKDLSGEYPSYFVYGPLVFAPANYQVHADPDPASPLSRRLYDKPGFPGEELVVVTSPLLRHKAIRGYNEVVNKVVKRVDGVGIKNFRHLIETLRDAKGEFVTIEFATKSADMIVLPRPEIEKITEEVMEENAIPRRGTADALAAWRKTGSRSGAQPGGT